VDARLQSYSSADRRSHPSKAAKHPSINRWRKRMKAAFDKASRPNSLRRRSPWSAWSVGGDQRAGQWWKASGSLRLWHSARLRARSWQGWQPHSLSSWRLPRREQRTRGQLRHAPNAAIPFPSVGAPTFSGSTLSRQNSSS
jgi:hypothetical protein